MSTSLGPDRPYPGLRPYRLEDAEWFFGRDEQSLTLYRLVDRGRLIAVVGGSGSGKSSVVRAGLLPLLREETDGASAGASGRRWIAWSLRPGNAPFAKLAETLAGTVGVHDDAKSHALHSADCERIEFKLRKSSFGLVDVLKDLHSDETLTPLVVIDQFEELFRFSDLPGSGAARARRRDEAAAFVQLLLEAASVSEPAIRVVLTMRSDYLGDCARFQGLPEAVTESEFLVPSLTRDQREQAIRGPAEKAGGSVSEELLQCLLNDSNEELDQLPVMQHALMRTWAQAKQRQSPQLQLTLDDYKAIGGIAESISRHADELLDELAEQGRDLAVEQIFRALAELDRQNRSTRRPLPLSQLIAETGVARADVIAVVDRLRAADCSFLVPAAKTGGTELRDDDVVDVGHEALVRRWSKISTHADGQRSGWLYDEVADGRIYVALLATAEGGEPGRPATLPIDQTASRIAWWERRPRSAAWAERYGGNIGVVLKLLEDSCKALRKSERDKARSKRNLLLAFAGVLVAAVLLPMLIVARHQYQIAQKQASLAREEKQRAETQTLLAMQETRRKEVAEKLARQREEDAKQAAEFAQKQERIARSESDSAARLRAEAETREKTAMKLSHEAEQARADAVKQRDLAERSKKVAWSNLLASRSVTEASSNIDRALLLSLAAMHVEPTAQARDGLLRGLQRAQRIETILGRHRSTVRSVAISPDGSTLASAGDDNRLIFWDLDRRRPLRSGDGVRADSVRVVAFSPNGELLAAGDADGNVTLWNAAAQTVQGERISARVGSVSSLSFNPDSESLAVGGQDGRVQIWDIKHKAVRGGPIVAFRAADTAASGKDASAPDSLDSDSAGRRRLRTLGVQLAYSPDGSLLAYSSHKGVTLQEVGPGQETGTTVLQDASLGQEADVLGESKVPSATSMAFSPDGKLLAVGTYGRRVQLWDVSTRKLAKNQLPILHQAEVTDVAFSHDGKVLASAGTDKRLILWDVSKRQVNGEPLVVNQAWPLSLAFGSDDKTLATGNSDNSLVLWDLTGRKALGTELKSHSGSVMTVAFSPDSQILASAGLDKRIIFWNPTTHDVQAILQGHTDVVSSLAFSSDGKRLASGSYDKQIRLWDVAKRQSTAILSGHQDRLFAVSFKPDGRLLLSGGKDKQLILWDVERGVQILPPLPEQRDVVVSVAFNPSGSVFASAGYDERIMLWDTVHRRTLEHSGLSLQDRIVSIAFSPDGKTIAAGGYDKQVTLWDVTSGKRIGEPLQGHQDPVWAIAFSPDGKVLASGGRDKQVLLWDVASRTRMGEALVKHTDPVRGLAFSRDGRFLASAGYDSRVMLWNVSLKDWERRACEIASPS